MGEYPKEDCGEQDKWEGGTQKCQARASGSSIRQTKTSINVKDIQQQFTLLRVESKVIGQTVYIARMQMNGHKNIILLGGA